MFYGYGVALERVLVEAGRVTLAGAALVAVPGFVTAVSDIAGRGP